MNDFTFEDSPWEQLLEQLKRGDSLSAVRFLTVMEEADEPALEDALQDMEDMDIMLDISDLPKPTGNSEAALRLRREEQLSQQEHFYTLLEESDPLRLYLEELAAIPVCGETELLAREAAAGDETARQRLLNLSLHKVVEQAREMTGRGVLLLDLIQEGSLGLWQAVCSYREGDFEAYSGRWIRRSMAKLVTLQARASGVGQKMRQAMEDYRAVDERLLGELGRNATLEEIALELHMTTDEAFSVKSMLESARLLGQVKPAEAPEEEQDEEERHVEDTAYFQMRQRIEDLLSGLEETDVKLLTLRFGLEGGRPLSHEETGKKLGLTPEEVLQREAGALARLRSGE